MRNLTLVFTMALKTIFSVSVYYEKEFHSYTIRIWLIYHITFIPETSIRPFRNKHDILEELNFSSSKYGIKMKFFSLITGNLVFRWRFGQMKMQQVESLYVYCQDVKCLIYMYSGNFSREYFFIFTFCLEHYWAFVSMLAAKMTLSKPSDKNW